MSVPRLAQRPMQRLAVRQPALLAVRSGLVGGTTRLGLQSRYVADASMPANTETVDTNSSILAKQRLNRPVSPHLAIYRPQITWYLSGLNRITGCVLSGAFYIYGTLYLIAPALGWHVGSATMAAGFAAWPVALKFLTKMTLALPFTFHSFNGLRHLVWDMGKTINNKTVQQTGWTVVGLSVVSALALALM